MEIKLNSLEKFADEFNIPIDNYKTYSEFKNALNQDQQKRQIKDNTYFDYVESEILEENNILYCGIYSQGQAERMGYDTF